MGAVSGVVTDQATHRPIEGVNIQLGPPPRGGARLGNQLTDERGRFVFVGVAAGTYFINATKAGYSEGHYGPGSMGALGGNIVLADGEWFKDASIEVTKLGAIGGTVQDERGQPVVGAYVRVLMQVPMAGQSRLAAGPVARTDDRGEYRIANLLPGKYLVVAPSVQHSVPASVSAADIEGVTAQQLATAETAAAARGRGSARRNGGALVDRQTALIIGNYVTPPPPVNGRPQAYPIVFYPGSLTLAGAASIELAGGGDRGGIDLQLQPVAAARVSGRLDGAPESFANFVLRLMPAGLEDLGTGSEAATTLVRPDGSFTFLNVPAGAYTLLAGGSSFELALRAASVGLRDPSVPLTPAVGRAGSGVTGGMVGSAPGVAYNIVAPAAASHEHGGYGRLAVTVGAADVTDLVVPLQSGGALSGQLTFEDITGAVPSGAIEVSAANASPALGVRSVSFNVTAAAGAGNTFGIPDLVPGEYVLRFNMAGVTVKSIVAGGEDLSRRSIAIKPGQDTPVQVTLTGRVIRLSGTVRDANGAAVPQASAIVFPVEKPLWSNYGINPTWIRPSVGSSNGSYQITNIKAGEYYVVGVTPSQSLAWRDPAFLESAVPFAVKTTLEWGDAKTLDVKVMVKR